MLHIVPRRSLEQENVLDDFGQFAHAGKGGSAVCQDWYEALLIRCTVWRPQSRAFSGINRCDSARDDQQASEQSFARRARRCPTKDAAWRPRRLAKPGRSSIVEGEHLVQYIFEREACLSGHRETRRRSRQTLTYKLTKTPVCVSLALLRRATAPRRDRVLW